MSSARLKTVEVVTKHGCHLCDIVLGELDLVGVNNPFSLKLTYLEDHPGLIAKFGNDIPVVLVDGNEVCRHKLDRGALIASLSEPEPTPPR
jgi:hypothetical protein